MDGFRKSVALALVPMLIIMACVAVHSAGAAEPILISGTVTDSFELETDDGLLLGIQPGEKGNELLFDHVGRRVAVTGTLIDDGGYQMIAIETYRVIED
jgi:hypothetical protein